MANENGSRKLKAAGLVGLGFIVGGALTMIPKCPPKKEVEIQFRDRVKTDTVVQWKTRECPAQHQEEPEEEPAAPVRPPKPPAKKCDKKTDECDPKAKPTGCDADKVCSRGCICVAKAQPKVKACKGRGQPISSTEGQSKYSTILAPMSNGVSNVASQLGDRDSVSVQVLVTTGGTACATAVKGDLDKKLKASVLNSVNGFLKGKSVTPPTQPETFEVKIPLK